MSPNKWIEHVKKFAKDNNLSYGCAISDKRCKDTYEKVQKKSYSDKKQEKNINIINSIVVGLKNKIKYSQNLDNDKPALRMKFSNMSKDAQALFIEKYKKYYDKIF